MKLLLYLSSFLTIISCSEPSSQKENLNQTKLLKEGEWHLQFKLSDSEKLPVDFSISKVKNNYSITFSNAKEKLIVDDITIENNKIIIKDPIYSSWFEGDIVSPNKITGFWYKGDKSYQIPFIAEQGVKERFSMPNRLNETQSNITGKWEVDFSKDNPKDHHKAIGQFNQVDNYVSGTFLTETGDYRFLEGNMYNDSLHLSCFDGSHAFLFKAKLTNGVLNGTFKSGSHWEEPWVATINEEYELSNPDSLTYLKEGYDKLSFTFLNTNGDSISLSDDKYKNKVVIVNIMGPWCPNCKDETAYLAKLYNDYNNKDLEIIALSFDKTTDFEIAKTNLLKVKNHFNAEYDFLIAGKANKTEARKSLPMLNHIMSYPTSIFLDKKGDIRKIRTGFYGPGTGKYYTKYVQNTNSFVQELLAE